MPAKLERCERWCDDVQQMIVKRLLCDRSPAPLWVVCIVIHFLGDPIQRTGRPLSRLTGP